jgi:23S rRNA (guanosine2251-2'-O)-methyltransferase
MKHRPHDHRSRQDKSRPERAPSERARPEKTRPAKTWPEKKWPEKKRPENKRPEASRTEKTRHEKARPENVQHGKIRYEKARPEKAASDQGRPVRAHAGTARTERIRPAHERQLPERRPPPAAEHRRDTHGSRIWIYGHHAVAAALANPERKILRLLATQEAFEKLSTDGGVPAQVLTRAHRASRLEIDGVLGDEYAHQGVALHTEPIVRRIEDVLEIAGAADSAAVVVLDQVTDPHNVGAIIRSAAALGAQAVLAPTRNAPGEGGILHKAASGALERIAFVPVVNIARAIEQLKEKGFWVVGLAADTETSLASLDLKGRIAFVLGAEGEGLRRLVRESCDFTARLPIESGAESLNVSNAAAIALYERARQIGKA